MVLVRLGEPRAAETPFEVNVTGWPAAASCDQLVPRSWQKALCSPQLSGISYPTSFLIYRSVAHYPGAKLTAHFHGCHLREGLGFLPRLSSSLTFWQAAGQNYLGTCISVCTLKSSFATATHGRKGQWMSNWARRDFYVNAAMSMCFLSSTFRKKKKPLCIYNQLFWESSCNSNGKLSVVKKHIVTNNKKLVESRACNSNKLNMPS